MTAAPRSLVVGIFRDPAEAEKAVRELREAGFTRDQVGFATRERSSGDVAGVVPPSGATGEALAGGVTGTVAGGLFGGLLGTAITVAVPGVGPVLGAGLFALIAAGASVGGLMGFLIGQGISEEEALRFQQELELGKALVIVRTEERYPEAHAILTAHGAREITRSADTEGK